MRASLLFLLLFFASTLGVKGFVEDDVNFFIEVNIDAILDGAEFIEEPRVYYEPLGGTTADRTAVTNVVKVQGISTLFRVSVSSAIMRKASMFSINYGRVFYKQYRRDELLELKQDTLRIDLRNSNDISRLAINAVGWIGADDPNASYEYDVFSKGSDKEVHATRSKNSIAKLFVCRSTRSYILFLRSHHGEGINTEEIPINIKSLKYNEVNKHPANPYKRVQISLIDPNAN